MDRLFSRSRSSLITSCTEQSGHPQRSVRAIIVFFFFQAEDGIRDLTVTGVQTCALPIYRQNPAVAACSFRPLERALVRLVLVLRQPAHEQRREAAVRQMRRRVLDDSLDRKSVV